MDVNYSQSLYDWARDLPPKIIDRISPSSLGSCLRSHYYQIKHEPITTPINPGQLLNMQTGFMWEKIISDGWKHARIPFIEQWKLSDSLLNLEGTLDFALVKPQGELEIWDSKTESSLASKFRRGSYLDSHPEYVHQLNCYALLARSQGFTVKRGGFIVIQRDNSFIEEFPFEFDELSIAGTLERISLLNNYLETDTVPPCDGKYCKLGLCAYGNPKTQKANDKGKVVNTACCPDSHRILNEWRTQ